MRKKRDGFIGVFLWKPGWGQSEPDLEFCRVSIPRTRAGTDQCGKKKKVEIEGVGLCTIHADKVREYLGIVEEGIELGTLWVASFSDGKVLCKKFNVRETAARYSIVNASSAVTSILGYRSSIPKGKGRKGITDAMLGSSFDPAYAGVTKEEALKRLEAHVDTCLRHSMDSVKRYKKDLEKVRAYGKKSGK